MLDGGRVYEFAAWAKWQDRGVPPELRVNVPSNAVISRCTGQDQARADGWQRLWTRLELKTTAQPTFLAVWVQGPGTVWLDDLSLREVTLPALTVSLDQGEYDASDRTASGLATAAKRVKPTQIRVGLTSAEGAVLDTIAVPFASGSAAKSDAGRLAAVILPGPDQCRFWFNPSALAPGRYAGQVALLDSAGQAIAERNVPFERNLDRD